ncbi:MAG: ATP-binding protein [Ramlibacter sp.]|nr:ATP-binding protein [Ramlibacter sp.]
METTLEVHESSQVAEVRRVVAEIGARLGLSETDLGRAALVATETATNLVKYARQGSVTVSAFEQGAATGIELVASDRGPGFVDFQASSRDGFSTGGSLGIGLGAILRASDAFDVYTVEAQGSVFFSRIAKGGVLPPQDGLAIAARSQPKRGQVECGDGWAFARAGRWQRLCVTDGLGHGPLAASASSEALDVFRKAGPADTPADIIRRAHGKLKATRGVVMGVFAVDSESRTALYSGVGNIVGAMHSGGQVNHLLSIDGVVGYNMRAARDQALTWAADGVVILASDGLSTRWNVARYPGLLERHPALVAAVLFRDYARDTDDATIAVAMERP